MSLFGSLFASVSALSSQSASLGMISDNIANVNTVGYKRKEADFESLVTTQSRSTAFSPGAVRANTINRIDQQGVIQQSRSSTDLAISGNGFFVVRSTADETALGNTFYTRSGAFSEDNKGVLVNTQGNVLFGWPLDQNGNIPANSADLNSLVAVDVAFLSGITRATSNIDLGVNLSAQDDPVTWPSFGGNTAIADTANFTRSVTVYDSLGQSQQLTLEFTHHTSPTATIAGNIDISGVGNIFDDLGGLGSSAIYTGNVDLATPADITALTGAPQAGDTFTLTMNGETRTITAPVTGAALVTEINTAFINSDPAALDGSGFITFGDTSIAGVSAVTTQIIIETGGSSPATEAELSAWGLTTGITNRIDRTFTLDDNGTGGDQQVSISEGDSTADLIAKINALDGINAQFNGDGEIIITNDVSGNNLDLTTPGGDALTNTELAILGLPTSGTTATPPIGPTLLTPLSTTANPQNWWDINILDTNGLSLSRGSVNFDGNGAINSNENPPSIDLTDVDFGGGAETQDISINLSNFTQFSDQYNVAFAEQDGAALGLRSGVFVDEDGIVKVSFTNGETAEVYKIPLATFANPNGLNERNGNLFQQSSDSGEFNLREANTGGAGVVEGSSLEASNVDLADEFSKMIVTQRAYSAATRVINTTDTMLDDLLRLR